MSNPGNLELQAEARLNQTLATGHGISSLPRLLARALGSSKNGRDCTQVSPELSGLRSQPSFSPGALEPR